MITFIAPTKNMKPCRDYPALSLPPFCIEAEALWSLMKTWNDEQIMQVMKVSAKKALQVEEQMKQIRFDQNGFPALFTYTGLAFQAMKVLDWDDTALCFAQSHLRILSGFYGVVRPLDAIYPYRLEMQAKDLSPQIGDLYTYWSDAITREMRRENEDGIYVNLASREYAQAVLPYLKATERCIHIEFRTVDHHTSKIIATHAKIARGKMARMIMTHQLDDPQSLTGFHEDGWQFHAASSDADHYVFQRQKGR